jgi:hypothetical protein
MRKPEQAFYDWLKKNRIFPGHHVRIENSVGVGQGDVNSCHAGRETWYELKVGRHENLTTHLLLDSQKAWHVRRVQEGGRVFVLVLDKDKIYVYKVLFCGIIKERYAEVGVFDKHQPLTLLVYIYAN